MGKLTKETLREILSRHKGAQMLIVIHWPTRKTLHLRVDRIPEEMLDVREYKYVSVID
jgi:hypothetical protein